MIINKACLSGLSMVAFAIGGLVPTVAAAQDAPAAPSAAQPVAEQVGGDIVVTAQRREERLIDVPISVSAVSGATLKEAGIQQPTDLVKLVPGITFQNVGAVSLFSIRGVSLNDFGDANESPVAFYVDDVYIAALAATSGQMFDVERVEVLRGPQGTLFGRNATGGLVQVISKKPTDAFTGTASLQYGSYNQVIAEAGIGGRIADGIRFRTAGIFNRDDGWQRNVVTNTRLAKQKSWALRQLVDIDLSPDAVLRLNIHGGHTDNQAPSYGFRGLLDPANPDIECSDADVIALRCVNAEGFRDPNPDPRHVYSDLAKLRLRVRNFGGNATLRWKLGKVSLTSITAAEKTNKFYQEDADASPQALFAVDYNADRKQFSQELRANGDAGALRWVTGLFYFNEKLSHGLVTIPTLTPFLGTYGLQNEYGQKTKSGAAFAQIDYDILENVTATGGIRYSKEKKSILISDDFANPFYIDSESAKVSRVTWKAGLNWKFVPNWLLYASVATGFKSPAFNTTLSLEGGSVAAKPEKNINYEIGLKGQSEDHRFQLSSAIFYTDYKDFQLISIPDNADVPASILLNADGARIYGAEVEINARPVQGLLLNSSATYLNTKINSPGLMAGDDLLDGKRLPRSPHWQLKGLASYEFAVGAGRAGLRANAAYRSATFSQLSNNVLGRIPSYVVVDGGLNWSPEGNRYRFEVFVDNLFDKEYNTYRYVLVDANALQWARPRTWGVRATAKW